MNDLPLKVLNRPGELESECLCCGRRFFARGGRIVQFCGTECKRHFEHVQAVNGRPAKNGDKIVVVDGYGAPCVGILYDAMPGNDHCNGKVAVIRPNDPCPNLKECLHWDDVKAGADLIMPKEAK